MKIDITLLTVLFVVLIGITGFNHTVSASEELQTIDGEELQRRAEEVLRSEPEAKKVTVREEISSKTVSHKNAIDLMSFDLNQDGTLSRDEVGEKLFQIFDRDGNSVIDNREMVRPSLLVFTPMQKKTIEIVDYGSGDKPQKTKTTETEFMKTTQLGKFDKDGDGLSPLDFLGMSFNRVNVIDDQVIDLYEFKRAYAESVRGMHEEPYNYNY